MTKTVIKVGNSNGIIFDSAFMDLAHVKPGDQFAISVHDGGSIVLTPLKPAMDTKKAAATAKRLIKKKLRTLSSSIMNQTLVHPTVDAVLAIHAEVLAAHGGSAGLRDIALLESAVNAPQASMMGRTLLTDPIEIAAAYLFYLCRNHPFVDGNKRTALATCLVFLSENEMLPVEELDADAWELLTLAVAASELDRAETTKRLRKLLKRR